jgi:hypothetical protein
MQTVTYEHGFTFSVSDVRICNYNIGGLMLAAKRGDDRAKLLFNALAKFMEEITGIWVGKWGDEDLREFQERIQTIEQDFFTEGEA